MTVLYFIRGDREWRTVWINDEYGYFRINGSGKTHPVEEVTKYISDIIKKGWRKTTLREMLKNKYRKGAKK